MEVVLASTSVSVNLSGTVNKGVTRVFNHNHDQNRTSSCLLQKRFEHNTMGFVINRQSSSSSTLSSLLLIHSARQPYWTRRAYPSTYLILYQRKKARLFDLSCWHFSRLVTPNYHLERNDFRIIRNSHGDFTWLARVYSSYSEEDGFSRTGRTDSGRGKNNNGNNSTMHAPSCYDTCSSFLIKSPFF